MTKLYSYEKIAFMITSIFFVNSLVSQDFMKDDKQWNVSEVMNFGGISTVIYYIDGDSIYNNID